jgi:hypothetical protein
VLRGKGKGVGTSGKKLTKERELRGKEGEGEPRGKEGEGEPREGEKELYQTVQINLDPKGMGHVVSSPLLLKPRTENDEGVPMKIDLRPLS